MVNFAASPSRRIAYERDDTLVTYWDDDVSGVTVASVADKDILNNEDDDNVNIQVGGATDGPFYLAFVFSQAVKLVSAKVITIENGTTVDIERSDDSTNGRDGTWVVQAATITHSELSSGVRPDYRKAIASVGSVAAHTGWRIKGATGLTNDFRYLCIHLYGEEHGPASRLAFWDPALDQELALDPDYQDNPRGARVERKFRIKNVSPTQTANGITLTTEQGPSHGRPDTWTLLSHKGSAFNTSVVIGNLGPGTVSGVITWRSDTPMNSELLTLSSRILPTVMSYS